VPETNGKEMTNFFKSQPQAELRARILETVRAGRSAQRSKAAFELDFDIEDPPEVFCKAYKLATLESVSELDDHDVVFPRRGKTDFSIKGNASFRKLLYDFQALYVMTCRPKRSCIAKSLVYIVQKVVFFLKFDFSLEPLTSSQIRYTYLLIHFVIASE